MILIDSLYINNSGGKILLDYLVKSIENEKMDAYYLFDIRCADDYKNIPEYRKIYLKPSLIKRHYFYLKNKNKFSKVFCFGNLGPTIKLDIPVYVYFHQRLYLDIPDTLSFKNKMIFEVKSFIFKQLLKNTDKVFLQTDSIRDEFIIKYKFYNSSNILVLPFYEQMNYLFEEKIKDSFVYISGGTKHKNHINLLDAFANAYKKLKRGTLTITISNDFPEIIVLINRYQKEGIPIINLGFVSKDNLPVIYANTEFCIYPSLTESFGLTIIEAIEGGCKIIGSDLPYMHTVCEPSILFNPTKINSIENAIEEALTSNSLNETTLKTTNKISTLIELLKT